MLTKVLQQGDLLQCDAVEGIQAQFGSGHIVERDDGGFSISKAVLLAFRVLTENTVVWERRAMLWRLRTPDDLVGQRQVD